MTLKLCTLIEYLINKNFLEKSYRKYAQKASADPYLFWKIIQISHCIQEIILKNKIF